MYSNVNGNVTTIATFIKCLESDCWPDFNCTINIVQSEDFNIYDSYQMIYQDFFDICPKVSSKEYVFSLLVHLIIFNKMFQ